MASEPNDHVAESLLQRAHSPDTAHTLFRERVKQRPLLLRPTSPDPHRDARSQRQYDRHKKSKAQRKSPKPKPLSAKQKRALCLYELPPAQRKYALYEPLHRMWCGYAREILGLSEGGRQHVDAHTAGPILVSADYHGARLEVTRSRCVSRVGLRGIVVKETKFAFEMVTAADELKLVPKEQTVFRFEVPGPGPEGEGEGDEEGRRPLVFEIRGEQFANRAPDRANKKFRAHFDPHL